MLKSRERKESEMMGLLKPRQQIAIRENGLSNSREYELIICENLSGPFEWHDMAKLVQFSAQKYYFTYILQIKHKKMCIYII